MSTVMLIAEASAGMVGGNVGLPPGLRSSATSDVDQYRLIYLMTRGAVDIRINRRGEVEEYLHHPLLRRPGSNLSF